MFALLAALAAQAAAAPEKTWPTREGDVVLKDFRFAAFWKKDLEELLARSEPN
ncbi:MAG TPA: hypothetical protein VGM04_03260 [Sphingomicrobium sp.]|jgi:hypothetical protein